jgi:hypothetical protein
LLIKAWPVGYQRYALTRNLPHGERYLHTHRFFGIRFKLFPETDTESVLKTERFHGRLGIAPIKNDAPAFCQLMRYRPFKNLGAIIGFQRYMNKSDGRRICWHIAAPCGLRYFIVGVEDYVGIITQGKFREK